MTEVCPYCKALKFNGETKGMCCASGKIKLPQLEEPPEPLKTLLAGSTAESKHFLSNIRKLQLMLPGSANQKICISAQQMVPQKIFYTHGHWEIRRICRELLATILIACAPSSPTQLWLKYKSNMAEDMFRQIHKANSNVDIDLTTDIYKLCLRLHQE
jgi:hypothetical protein